MRSKDQGGGLSLQTLVIASLSSLAAALFIHEFWQGGAILGAAVTPVIVALVSEALRKPAERLTSVRNPPPVVAPERDDRFGIWEEQRPRRRGLHVKLAVATGVVAFLIAAFFLTGAELVLGGAGDSDRFRYVPGKQERRDAARDPRPEPEERAPAPEEEQAPEQPTQTEPPPEEEAEPPAETAPAPPPETEPPAEPVDPAPAP